MRLGECSASAVVRIAVSGERRSCETERSSAVLITSLRRSAAVSTTSACSASRSSAAASSASSAGAIRTCTRRSTGSGAPAGSTSVPIWRVPSRSAKTTLRSPASTARSSIAALREAQRLGEPRADARQRLLQPPAAQQQPRHLGRQVGLLAALVGLQRALAGDLGQRARADGGEEEDASADPVLPRRDREAPGGRDVEEVERERADDGGRQRQPRAPDRRHDQHDEQVDDAERQHGRDVVERVDQQRGQRDADRRRRDSDEQWRAALEHRALRLAPDLLRDLHDQPQLGGLLLDA